MSKHGAAGERTAFVALDGLRGVAALAVVLFHIPNFTGVMLLPGAYLAVDLFFCISGFVLVHAYADRLNAGMGIGPFMLRRVIRLYPLYLLSGLLALAYIFTLGSGDNFTGNGPLCHLLNLALIPMPQHWNAHADLFPVNFVAWSILIELAASLAFALFLPVLLKRRHLPRLIMVAAPLLIASALFYGDLNLGVTLSQTPGALARALFSFSAGIAIALARRDGAASPGISFPLLALATVAPMTLPLTGAARIAIDLTSVLLVFPALVHAAASCRIDGRTRRIATILGSASYALYILQVPMIAFAAAAITIWGGGPSLPLGMGFVALLLVMSIVIDRHVDQPLRAWLTQAMVRRAPRMVVPRPATAP